MGQESQIYSDDIILLVCALCVLCAASVGEDKVGATINVACQIAKIVCLIIQTFSQTRDSVIPISVNVGLRIFSGSDVHSCLNPRP